MSQTHTTDISRTHSGWVSRHIDEEVARLGRAATAEASNLKEPTNHYHPSHIPPAYTQPHNHTTTQPHNHAVAESTATKLSELQDLAEQQQQEISNSKAFAKLQQQKICDLFSACLKLKTVLERRDEVEHVTRSAAFSIGFFSICICLFYRSLFVYIRLFRRLLLVHNLLHFP